MTKSELKRMCTQNPSGMADEIEGLTALANFWCDEYEKQKARADAAEEKLKAFEWRHIETAKKSNNRKHVLLFGDGSSFSKCVFIGFCDGQKWFPFDGNDDVYPTHWMPLPPAP